MKVTDVRLVIIYDRFSPKSITLTLHRRKCAMDQTLSVPLSKETMETPQYNRKM